MKSDNIIAKILLPLPFNDGFIYFIKSDYNPQIGDIFQIPFGKKQLFGILIDILEQIPDNIKEDKIKFAQDKLSDFKIDSKLIEFFFWVAKYNLAPAGLIAKLSIATFLKNSNKKLNQIIFKINEDCNFEGKITPKRQIILDFINKSEKT
ncbi:hypothetical protein N8772_01690, partial [Rickettsiales bacterium]|nr:hypothetical protein [Rickettsiales bacterium]